MPDQMEFAVDKGPETKPETPVLFQKIVKYCKELHGKFNGSEYRNRTIKEIEESHRTYDQISEDTDFPFEGAVNEVLPLTTITVDNMEPRLVAGLIGKDPIVRFEMSGMEKKDEPTEMLEDWFNKELKNSVSIKQSTIQLVHTGLMEGTTYAVPGYSLNEKKKRTFVMDGQTGYPMTDEKGSRQSQEISETVSEGGVIEYVPFTDVFLADDVGTVKEWEECDKIRIVRPTYAELQRKKGGLGYIPENIGPHLLGGKTDLPEPSPGQKVSGVEITGKEVIECLECHISYPIYQDEEKNEDEQSNFEEERIIITFSVQSETVIRFLKQTDLIMENTSLIKRSRMFAEPGKSYGVSMYGKLKSIQNGASDIFNMVINIAYLTMMPWFFYDSKSGLRGEITLTPGAGVQVDSVDGIKIPSFNMNPAQYLEFMNIFMSLWEKLGNISDTQIGRTRDQNTTATEIMTVVQEGNIKHNYQSEQMKEEFLDILRTLYDLYYERMDPKKKFIYAGKEVQIPYPLMRRGYRFALNGATEAANKYIDRREKEDMLKMFGQDPYIIPTMPREELLKAYGITETDQWINPQVKQIVDLAMANPEIAQVIGTYMQEKAAVQQAIGGQGERTVPNGGVSKVPTTGTGSGGGLPSGNVVGGPAVRPGSIGPPV